MKERNERRPRHHQACDKEEVERIHVMLGGEVDGHLVIVWTQVVEDSSGIVKGGKVGDVAGVHLLIERGVELYGDVW